MISMVAMLCLLTGQVPIRTTLIEGGVVVDPSTGTRIRACDFFLCLWKSGKLVAKISCEGSSEPRTILLLRGDLITTDGASSVAHYDPKTEGVATYKWLLAARIIHAYDIKRLHAIWDIPQLIYGLPIWYSNSHVYSLYIDNPEECIRNLSSKPDISLVERILTSRTIIHKSNLKLSRSEARWLFDNYIAQESPKVSRIKFGKITHIYNLFDKNYICR